MTATRAKLLSELPGSDMERQFNYFLGRAADTRREMPCGDRYKKLVRQAGLRPTHQRMALARILFSAANRHITAEMLYDEAVKARIAVSLATVYNTLKQFTEAGLLRQICVNSSKSFFDTNPGEHPHFFVEDENMLIDIPDAEAVVDKLPQAPEGFEIVQVAVVVQLRRKQS